MKNIRNEAFADYKAGAKIADISEKYDVSVNTVKSWARRHWKLQKGATVTPESNRRVQPRPHGAPKGNRNNLVHGAYRYIRCDDIDDEFMDYIESNSEQILKELYVFYIVRELRIMKKQLELKRAYEERGIDLNTKIIHVSRSWKGKKVEKTITRIPSYYSLYISLEQELTRISRAILEIAMLRYKVEGNKKASESATRKIYGMVETAETVEKRIAQVMRQLPAAA